MLKTMTIEMDTEVYLVFEKAFLREVPNDVMEHDLDAGVMVNKYTDFEWIKFKILTYAGGKAERGARKLVLDGDPVDKELIKQVIESNLKE